MSSQELVEIQKIKRLIEKSTRVVRTRAKKIKIKDLLSAENVSERLNAFLDKLTLDDLLQMSAIITVAVIIKQGIEWSENLKEYAKIINWLALPDFFMFTRYARTERPTGEPTPEWLEWAISIGISYLIVRHFPEVIKAGKNIIDIAKTLIPTTIAG